MNSIYDMGEQPLSKHEVTKARQSAKQLLRRRTKQAIYAVVALFLSCASVVPFSKGHSLHSHAEPYGRILVYLAMGLLIPFVIYVGRAINAWVYLRDISRIDS